MLIRNTGLPNNKYSSTYAFIDQTLESTPNIDDNDLNLVVQAALQRNGVDFTNDGSIRGGYVKGTRKHKKNRKYVKKTTRKQKGGFIWGKSKKTVTNSPATTSTTKSSSSLTHSKKKYKINRARGFTKRRK